MFLPVLFPVTLIVIVTLDIAVVLGLSAALRWWRK